MQKCQKEEENLKSVTKGMRFEQSIFLNFIFLKREQGLYCEFLLTSLSLMIVL